MPDTWKNRGNKIHHRAIDVSTYEYDGERIIVEGFLQDNRYRETHAVTGETFPQGIIHHMGIRLLVNTSTFVIEDLDMELLSVPREVCRETLGSLAPVKGLTITRGFTAKVKKLVGGTKGCTHVLELLLAMAPTVIQGAATHRSSGKTKPDANQAKMMLEYLINTCHAWREDGPFVTRLKKTLPLQE